MNNKLCPKCNQIKSVNEFYIRSGTNKLQSYCKDCKNLVCSNGGYDYKKNREYRTLLKRKVMYHYSNGRLCCRCCGERHMEFLTIDHINNDGAEHRRKIGKTQYDVCRWIINNNFPEGFQVLCFNCNCAKEYSGYCPHQKIKHNSQLWLNLLSEVEQLKIG